MPLAQPVKSQEKTSTNNGKVGKKMTISIPTAQETHRALKPADSSATKSSF